MAQSGPLALGMRLLIDDKRLAMIGNVLALLQEGVLDPIERFAGRPESWTSRGNSLFPRAA
jgi:hypothetical protein